MRVLLAFVFIVAAVATASDIHAAGAWSQKGTPTKIQVVKSLGFLIVGPFGNEGPTSCGLDDVLWVDISHPQYDQLYSMTLTALTTGANIKGYAHACTVVSWYSASTINEIKSSGAMELTR